MNTLYSDILVICILCSRELRIFKCGDDDALGMLSHKVMALCWGLTYWLCQLDQGDIMSTSSREKKVPGHVNKSSLLQNTALTGPHCEEEGYCIILKGFILW